ncbi:LptE family protein [uncultured Psychroserpens sp.]|uniref:LptE family protein n=1 Tax=uncultured Psychroserpens sp. TaxID=255436 RepID=UPI00263537AB|nr:LptE family protein [uncultured Psychroserpens sp.]
MKTVKYFTIFCFTFVVLSCGKYSFTNIDIGDAKTVQINFFDNYAKLIEPGIDNDFTNALQELITNQTQLNLVSKKGDLTYEGEITEYRIFPTSANAKSRASQNRLKMTVNVRFFNNLDESKNFEKSFSFFFDYDGSIQLIGSQKEAALETIFDRITQDIFNESLASNF